MFIFGVLVKDSSGQKNYASWILKPYDYYHDLFDVLSDIWLKERFDLILSNHSNRKKYLIIYELYKVMTANSADVGKRTTLSNKDYCYGSFDDFFFLETDNLLIVKSLNDVYGIQLYIALLYSTNI